MRNYPDLGVQMSIFSAQSHHRPGKMGVIACDQFTSQPEYWQEVERTGGRSSIHLQVILPEVYLDAPDGVLRIKRIQANMKVYLEQGMFTSPRTA